MASEYNADVAIIGAGPAGTAAAIHLGQLGAGNVILVDRHDFPRDKTCGSGVSPKGLDVLKALGVWDQVMPEAYWIKGLRLVKTFYRLKDKDYSYRKELFSLSPVDDEHAGLVIQHGPRSQRVVIDLTIKNRWSEFDESVY